MLSFFFGFVIGNGLGLMVRAIGGVYRLAACTGLAMVAGVANALTGGASVERAASIASGIFAGLIMGYCAGELVERRPGPPRLSGIAAGYGRLAETFLHGLVYGPNVPGANAAQQSLASVWVGRSKKLAGVAVWITTWWLVFRAQSFFWRSQGEILLPGGFLLGLLLYLEGVQNVVVAAVHSRPMGEAPPGNPALQRGGINPRSADAGAGNDLSS